MCHIPIEQLSPEIREIARNNYSLLLQRLASMGQNNVADATGVSESKMSRLKGSEDKQGDLELFAVLSAVMGFKLTDKEEIFCDPKMVDAIGVVLGRAYSAPDFMRQMFSGGHK